MAQSETPGGDGAPAAPLALPRIDRYRLVERIGRGGMGEVYRAHDERLGRAVALKLLPFSRAMRADRVERRHARLMREAQAASALNHPGIVTLHDVGVFGDRIYLVMELVDGEPFSALAKRGVPVVEAVRLTAEAADALEAAHARNILHRDVKSDNLMRARDGRVKVVDFGLAKLGEAPRAPTAPEWSSDEATLASAEGDEDDGPCSAASLAGPDTEGEPSERAPRSGRLTREGDVLGTPAYMAPEQLDGAAADACTEVFSLGVVLYELLTGRRPRPDAPTSGDRIVPPSRAAPGRRIPPSLDAVTMRALAVDRALRHGSMGELAAALRATARAPRAPRRWAAVALVLAATPTTAWALGAFEPAAAPLGAPGGSAAASVTAAPAPSAVAEARADAVAPVGATSASVAGSSPERGDAPLAAGAPSAAVEADARSDASPEPQRRRTGPGAPTPARAAAGVLAAPAATAAGRAAAEVPSAPVPAPSPAFDPMGDRQ